MVSAFLSYSWDDDAHKTWVRDLAIRLRHDCVETILDQWHSAPGDMITKFMETAVRDNDFVLCVCTPKYKGRSDGRIGNTGYEGDIMTGEVSTMKNQRKFIPLLRSGSEQESIPTWMRGKYFVDLRDSPLSETAYQDLLSTLLGNREAPPPPGEPLSGGAAVSAHAKGPYYHVIIWGFGWRYAFDNLTHDALERRFIIPFLFAKVRRLREADECGILDPIAMGRVEGMLSKKFPDARRNGERVAFNASGLYIYRTDAKILAARVALAMVLPFQIAFWPIGELSVTHEVISHFVITNCITLSDALDC